MLKLWKELAGRYSNKQENNITGFNVVKALTIVVNDIQMYGMEKNTDFAKGWLCPLYKKGDKTDIRNYCPITVLNADYKIFVKALTNRLKLIALLIIHCD